MSCYLFSQGSQWDICRRELNRLAGVELKDEDDINTAFSTFATRLTSVTIPRRTTSFRS